jgi:DNA repair protein RadC
MVGERATHLDLESLRERMMKLGSETLSTTELVAMALGTGAGNNALELTERLMLEYGGLLGVARLGLADLCEVPGMGIAKATQLRAMLDLSERLRIETRAVEKTKIVRPADVADLYMPEMSFLEQEHLRTVLLDRRNNIIAVHEVYQGTLTSIDVQPRDVFREAIRRNCAAIIVVHNHPSGDPQPSTEDVRATQQLVEAGKLLDIQVLDHLIIGHGQYVSLRERGVGFNG